MYVSEVLCLERMNHIFVILSGRRERAMFGRESQRTVFRIGRQMIGPPVLEVRLVGTTGRLTFNQMALFLIPKNFCKDLKLRSKFRFI